MFNGCVAAMNRAPFLVRWPSFFCVLVTVSVVVFVMALALLCGGGERKKKKKKQGIKVRN